MMDDDRMTGCCDFCGMYTANNTSESGGHTSKCPMHPKNKANRIVKASDEKQMRDLLQLGFNNRWCMKVRLIQKKPEVYEIEYETWTDTLKNE